MIKNDRYILIGLIGVFIITIASLSMVSPSFGHSKNVSPLGVFKNIPPIILQTQNDKQYKFDVDILQDAGHSTGEPNTSVNSHAHGHNVQLKSGEQLTITYGPSPYGSAVFVRASLLKGEINVQEGPNGYVRLTGQNIVLLQDSGGQGNSQVMIPSTIERGDYKLVILTTYSEEMHGYYITNAKIR